MSRYTIISLIHPILCHISSQSPTLPHCMVIRFSDAEAARVKSASKLVSSIATSSTGLQEGIFNMACESAVADAHHIVPPSAASLFLFLSSPCPLPLLLHILHSFSHSFSLFFCMPVLRSCCHIVQHIRNSILHCTALHCTIFHCITLYSTVHLSKSHII